MSEHVIEATVNNVMVRKSVRARTTLSDFIRVDCNLTGTHVGCEHGVCGACTVVVDNVAVRSCLMLAVQADGAVIETVESIAPSGGLDAIQQALHDEHGLQCGFCTPGIIMTLAALRRQSPPAAEAEMLEALSGHLCRCTGYQGIVKAIRSLTEPAQ